MELEISKINYDTIEENIEDNFINKIDLLKDLPIEMQIEKDNILNTFNNLYTWYIHNDDIISRIPNPFYSDYVLIKSLTCINLLNTRDLNEELLNKFQNNYI
jgi:hypothetical protein